MRISLGDAARRVRRRWPFEVAVKLLGGYRRRYLVGWGRVGNTDWRCGCAGSFDGGESSIRSARHSGCSELGMCVTHLYKVLAERSTYSGRSETRIFVEFTPETGKKP